MARATGRFDLTRWDEQAVHEDETGRHARVANTKVFEGGITGTSETELVQAVLASGPMAYVAIERIEAAVEGRKGTFVLVHRATASADGGSMDVEVLAGSGTSELAALTGRLTMERSAEGEHTYSFEYELG